MKYYETTFEEYTNAVETFNLHPELSQFTQFPIKVQHFKNVILYGPSGVGKYSQALKIIKKYSPSGLKYDKKLSITNEKYEKKTKKAVSASTDEKPKGKTKTVAYTKKLDYTYRISDIHYEIDMSTLGCNSKNVWHDIFFQIVDIVSIKPEKVGIILCKNFHSIYNELLDVFNSYVRHPLHHYNIQIHFILLTEHIGFIPDNILQACEVINVARPKKEAYLQMVHCQDPNISKSGFPPKSSFGTNIIERIKQIDSSSLINSKEIYLLQNTKDVQDIPENVFDIITNNIIELILAPEKIKISELRNHLYDLLIYNVDVPECICYIFFDLVERNAIQDKALISDTLRQIFIFFKYFNNNYRSIYHLESIVFFLIHKIHYEIK
jgi:hypothetical protein